MGWGCRADENLDGYLSDLLICWLGDDNWGNEMGSK